MYRLLGLLFAFVFFFVGFMERSGWSDESLIPFQAEAVSEDHYHLDRLLIDTELKGLSVGVSAFSNKPPYRYCTTLGLNYCSVWEEEEIPVFVDSSADEMFKEAVREAVKVWNMAMGLTLKYEGEFDIKNEIKKCALWVNGYDSHRGIFVIPVREDEAIHSCLTGGAGSTWTVGIGGKFDYAIVYIEYVSGERSMSGLFPTALHELGHAIGLDHPFDHNEDDTFSVMNYYDKHATHLTYNDLDVIQYIYGPSSKPRGDFSVKTSWNLNTMDFESGRPSRYCIFGGTPDFSLSNTRVDDDYPFCFYVNDMDNKVTVSDSNARTCSFLPSSYTDSEDLTVVCQSREQDSGDDTGSDDSEHEDECYYYSIPTYQEVLVAGLGEGQPARLLEVLPDGTKRFKLNTCFANDAYVLTGLILNRTWHIIWLKPNCMYGFEIGKTKGLNCILDVPPYYADSYLFWIFAGKNFALPSFDWESEPYKVVIIKLF